MRKIEQAMLNAVHNKKNWKQGNTEVRYSEGKNTSCVTLYGNFIYSYYYDTGEVIFSLCGWNTQTTRSRLNTLGVSISVLHVDVGGKQISITPEAVYSILNNELKEL